MGGRNASAHRSQAILLAVRGLQCMSQPFGAPESGSCKHSSATAFLMGTVFVHDFAALEPILVTLVHLSEATWKERFV